MGIRSWEPGQGKRRQAVPNGPIAEVVIGAEDGAGVGVVDVTVPAGAAMGEHAHGDSATLLIPQEGRLLLIDAASEAETELVPGSLTTIPIGHKVRLENRESCEARMLVVLSPPDFAAAVASWPEVAWATSQ